MDKLVFDSIEYDTIPFGAAVTNSSARFSLIKPKRKSVAKICESVTGVDSIKLQTNKGKTLAEYKGYTEFDGYQLQNNYLMPKRNPEDADVYVDVVNVYLKRPENK